MDGAEALALVEPRKKSAPMRYEVVLLLCATGRASVQDICYFTGASAQTLKGLEKSGIVAFSEEEKLRIPEPKAVRPGPPIVLNAEQQSAFEHLLALTESQKPEAALLQGVTGSGKTQVYIRLAQEVLKRGRSVIVLVPEIVLTPQMMEKFSSYFGSQVAMYSQTLFLAGIILFGFTTFFQLVTLPVEFNASARAIETIEGQGLLEDDELLGAKKVLRAAALTYVAALLTSLLQLMRFVAIFAARGGGGNRRGGGR